MRSLAAAAALLLTSSIASGALAQGEKPAVEAAPTPAPTSAAAAASDAPAPAELAAPATPPAAPVAAPPAVAALPRCAAGDQEGIDPADAHTATNLVCAEIARHGAPADAHYRVSLGKLGSLIIVGAARVSDDGATVDSRELRIGNIEEVPIAAPRIAESIVHGTPLAETQTIDNIVSSESRVPQRKTGSAHFALGLLGMFPPFGDATGVAPGVDLDLHYEIGQGEVGGDFRAGGIGSGNGNSPQMGLAVLSVGGRYFTSDRDVSPYFGGGLAWSYFSLGLPDGGFSGNASGLGAFADAGLEVMRTSHAHLAFGVRLDVPFYQLNETGGMTTATGYGNGPVQSPPSQTYYAPLSLETRLTF